MPQCESHQLGEWSPCHCRRCAVRPGRREGGGGQLKCRGCQCHDRGLVVLCVHTDPVDPPTTSFNRDKSDVFRRGWLTFEAVGDHRWVGAQQEWVRPKKLQKKLERDLWPALGVPAARNTPRPHRRPRLLSRIDGCGGPERYLRPLFGPGRVGAQKKTDPNPGPVPPRPDVLWRVALRRFMPRQHPSGF